MKNEHRWREIALRLDKAVVSKQFYRHVFCYADIFDLQTHTSFYHMLKVGRAPSNSLILTHSQLSIAANISRDVTDQNDCGAHESGNCNGSACGRRPTRKLLVTTTWMASRQPVRSCEIDTRRVCIATAWDKKA